MCHNCKDLIKQDISIRKLEKKKNGITTDEARSDSFLYFFSVCNILVARMTLGISSYRLHRFTNDITHSISTSLREGEVKILLSSYLSVYQQAYATAKA